ncbi:MAG TPA: GNAT family N-acetyltransferase, partial [Rhodoferax sp.]
RFSAGSVLTAALMRHVIDVDHVEEVDYLTGDDAYKRDWMSHRRERWGIVAFDLRTAAGLWAWLRHWAGKKFKRHNADEKVSIRVCL